MLTLFAILCLSHPVQVAPLDLDGLTISYRSALKSLPGDLLFDVGPSPSKIPPLGEHLTFGQVERYATVLHRNYAEVGGISIFRFPADDQPKSNMEGALFALGLLSQDALAQGFGDGLRMNSLRPDVRDRVLNEIAPTSEVAQRLEAAGNRALVRLSFGAVAVMRNGTSAAQTYNMFTQATAFPTRVLQADSQGDTASAAPIPPLVVTSDSGPLSFGEGRLLTVGELVEIMGTEFKTRFFIDPRLKADYVFIKGTFSKAGMVKAMAELSTTSKFSESGGLEGAFNSMLERLGDYARKQQPAVVPDLSKLKNYPSYDIDSFRTLCQESEDVTRQMHLSSDGQVQMFPCVYVSVNGGTPDTTYILRLVGRKPG